MKSYFKKHMGLFIGVIFLLLLKVVFNVSLTNLKGGLIDVATGKDFGQLKKLLLAFLLTVVVTIFFPLHLCYI